jgi:hypothetical protein
MSPPRVVLRLVVACLLAACASSSAQPRTTSGSGEAPAAPAGFPGFDTREYPGDAAMAQWRARSPYRWVGYYLPAPCYTGTSWTEKRAALERMGWGIAILFVGEQDWAAGAAPPADSVPARCTRSNVTAERGARDGAEAAAGARAEGFRGGSSIWLDVERTDSVGASLRGYVGSWASAVRAAGFSPGVYAHARNADELARAMRDGDGPAAPVWVASEAGFDLALHPSASGVAGALVWQGAFDVRETWGDATLRIDRNVATSPSPSAPR